MAVAVEARSNTEVLIVGKLGGDVGVRFFFVCLSLCFSVLLRLGSVEWKMWWGFGWSGDGAIDSDYYNR